MGSDLLHTPSKIICVLCGTSDENVITGAFSSKEDISAHQNCLLYASGLFCRNSPTYDDLFGFDVEDVKQEVRRGKKLTCHRCKKIGATAGCDVKRCKRSYHYPCSIKDNARTIDDGTKGSFTLYCEKHDPQNRKTSLGNSTSGLKRFKRYGSSDSHGRMPDRSESNSSTGSSELGLASGRKRRSPVVFFDKHDENQTCVESIFAPVESDLENCTPPQQDNSAPVAENVRPCEELNPSSTGSVCEASTSGLNNSKGDGSPANPGQLNNMVEFDSAPLSPEVETPRRKKRRLSVLLSDDDELLTSTDPVVFPAMSDTPIPHTHSTPVNGNTRSCEELNPLTTDDGDDTDIESDMSQSLLSSETYKVTVPCFVLMDSGPSMESENSVEPCSPSNAVPADACTIPESVTAPEPGETASTDGTAPEPKAPTTGSASPGFADPEPHQEHSSCGSSDPPGSPDRSSPTSELPAALPSAVQPLPPFHFTADQPADLPPPAGVSSSPDRPAEEEGCGVDATASVRSSAATFWARCNEAGCTEEIFSEIVSQLSTLRIRIQSQEASHQDFDVALKVLEASGRLPTIIIQLEQDLEKQEQELQRKKAALKDARAVLGIHNLN